MNTEKPDLTFGIVTDAQYADQEPWNNRYFRNTPQKLYEASLVFNHERPAFVINLGDIIDQGYEHYEPVLAAFKQIQPLKYHVTGNHDFLVRQELKARVRQKLTPGGSWYRFDAGHDTFIVLDGNDVSLHAYAEGSHHYEQAQVYLKQLEKAQKPNAKSFNGAIGKKQLNWLQNTLQEAWQYNRRVFIFCHYPVYPQTYYNLWNDEALLALISRYPVVKAWMNGHNHAGNYGYQQGVHFINFKGMVEGEKTNSFAVIRLYPDRLVVEGHGNEENRICVF